MLYFLKYPSFFLSTGESLNMNYKIVPLDFGVRAHHAARFERQGSSVLSIRYILVVLLESPNFTAVFISPCLRSACCPSLL